MMMMINIDKHRGKQCKRVGNGNRSSTERINRCESDQVVRRREREHHHHRDDHLLIVVHDAEEEEEEE